MLKSTSLFRFRTVYPLLFSKVLFGVSSNVNIVEHDEILKPVERGIFYGGKIKLMDSKKGSKSEESENTELKEKSRMDRLRFSKTVKQIEESVLKNPRDTKTIKTILDKLMLQKQQIDSPALYMKLFTLLFKLKSNEPALFFIEQSKEFARRFLSLYSEKEILFMIWALLKIKSQDREFIKDLKEHFCSLQHSKNHENYLNILRMVLDMKFYDPETSLEIYKSIRNEIIGFISSCPKPGEVALLCRYLLELGEAETGLWERILKTLSQNIGDLTPTELSEYLWALSHQKGSYDDPESIPTEQIGDWNQIAPVLKKNIQSFDLNELNVVAYSLKKLSWTPEEETKQLFRSRLMTLYNGNYRQFEKMTLSQLFCSLLSFSMMELKDKPLYKQTLLNINRKIIQLQKSDLVFFVGCLDVFYPDPQEHDQNQVSFEYFESFVKNNLHSLDFSLLILIFKKYNFSFKYREEVILKYLLLMVPEFKDKELVFFLSTITSLKISLSPEQIHNLISALWNHLTKLSLSYFSVTVKNLGKLHHVTPDLDEIMKLANSMVIKLINDTQVNLLGKQVELCHLLIGISEYGYIDENFWKQVEISLLQKYFHMSIDCKIIMAQIAAKHFSDEFCAFIQQITVKMLPNLTNMQMINQLRSIETMRDTSIQQYFWNTVEQEIKDRYSKGKVTLKELTALILTMKSHKAGSYKFWEDVAFFMSSHESFKKLDVSNVSERSVLINALEAFRLNKKLTAKFCNEILPQVLKISSQNKLYKSEIYEITASYSWVRIADDELWFNLEKHVESCYRTFHLPRFFDIVISFGKAKKGGKDFWGTMKKYLNEVQDYITDFHLPKLLRVIEGNASFVFRKWATLFYLRMENKMSDNEKFIKDLEEIKKNRSLFEAFKNFDCLKLVNHWKENVRFNVTDDQKRQEIDNLLMELIKEEK